MSIVKNSDFNLLDNLLKSLEVNSWHSSRGHITLNRISDRESNKRQMFCCYKIYGIMTQMSYIEMWSYDLLH